MYLRFIAPRQYRRGIDHGLFRPAYEIVRDPAADAGLRGAIRHELDWFEDWLPVPRRRAFLVKSCKRWRADGICWFRDDAREMIARAHVLACLLDLAGVPVSRVRTRRPGQILYRDAWQIVAKPEEATPTLWH